MPACLNFRDVGEWITVLAGRELLPARRLLRGGKLDAVQSPVEIGDPGTIVNLRVGPDHEVFGAESRHVAIPNAIEKYDTRRSDVRRWLGAVVQTVAEAPPAGSARCGDLRGLEWVQWSPAKGRSAADAVAKALGVRSHGGASASPATRSICSVCCGQSWDPW